MNRFDQAVGATSYPGRGILAGRSAGGQCLMAYFIMGRSANSRNRIFVEEGQGLRTQAYDASQVVDPSLIIYHPVRTYKNMTIVTNGDQTDTVYASLLSGGTFEGALRTRTFEPDPPNFTPRVSALIALSDGAMHLAMSILKAGDPMGASVVRHFFEYENLLPGQGYFLHTYQGDGNPLPSFEGEPERVAMAGDLREFADAVWRGLDGENKLSLWARWVDLHTGETQTVIYNKHG